MNYNFLYKYLILGTKNRYVCLAYDTSRTMLVSLLKSYNKTKWHQPFSCSEPEHRIKISKQKPHHIDIQI